MLRFAVLGLGLSALALAQTATPSVAVTARALQPGELVLLSVTTPTPATAVTGRALGRTLRGARIDDRRWDLLLGLDLDVAPGRHTVEVDITTAEGPVRLAKPLVITAKRFPTRRLTVDDAFVNPPPEVQARIAEEAKILEQIWVTSAPDRLWTGPFTPPVPQSANSAFGTRSIFNGQPRSPHGGADFPSPAGTAVHAPGGGRVVLARDLYYTGQTVVVDHGGGLVSLFAHLSRIDVAQDASISTGQQLGLVGATGRVTGPHLHWTVRAGTARIDPVSLLSVLGRKSAPQN